MSPAPQPMDMPSVRGRSSPINSGVVDADSSRRGKKRDAYDAFSSPDTEWSTLPAKKKSKSSSTAAEWGQTSTTKFRLPLATPMQKNGDEARPRKALFKPPPPAVPRPDAPAGPSRWKVTRISLSDALRGEDPPPDRNHMYVGMHGYPSPPRHGSSPPPPDLSIRPADQAHEAGAPAAIAPASSHSPRRAPGPATPPRSVSPPGGCAPDAVAWFPSAAGERRERHSRVRRRAAERRRAAAELWDVLGLSSCGVVYEDGWTRGAEIAFVQWGGADDAADDNCITKRGS
ncbi:hypothetical protein PHLGIDRAFT_121856 [Phlebiopsis gigantea 11061_1 CR5-6]|uniref:Uncharacterized protein n=1 Tax=Phlebiopsis gigantea (strain 11061_1 CR5-6) TaxID=745531 RepID=A0A0C3PD20_PHLG1|nr:hypothetical protein PHLGIDRAFT_121856 [Phlebiopsis gigantea 11061_1 CR5-6]